MPLATSLPPELLHDIFSLSVPKSPCGSSSEYYSRQTILRRFSQVHRKWTPIAQEILELEVWIYAREDGTGGVREEEALRKMGQLLRTPTQPTKYLTVDGCLRGIVNYAGKDLWRKVSFLRTGVEHGELSIGATFTMRHLSFFTGLQELILHNIYWKTNSLVEVHYVKLFPNLRRVVLSGTTNLLGWGHLHWEQFSPKNMPNLVHLAIPTTELDMAFKAPQLSSLAITEIREFKRMRRDDYEYLGELDRLPNLCHLSLDFPSQIPSLPLGNLFNLHLISLHLPRHFERWIIEDAPARP